ncbi:MAG: T9SS type A sorting domain-containing protein [bacterium]
MKKVLLLVVFFVMVASAYAQVVTPVWEKSAAQSNRPAWFDAGHLTRGFDYGVIGGQERLIVASRNGGSFIYILDAATGDSLGKLTNGAALTGGTYTISDVAISDDGIVFVCNLALPAGLFKIYKFSSLTDTAVVAATYQSTTQRLGDKFSVSGKASDNTLTIWAASASTAEVVKFTTIDNGATFIPTLMPLTAAVFGGSASITPFAGGFYYNATGLNPKKLDLTGATVGTVLGTVVSTGSNAVKYITSVGDDDYFVSFAFGTGNENGRIVRVNDGVAESAVLYGVTSTLGTVANGNGAGDVSIKKNTDNTYTVYVLSCNNGLGAYKLDLGLAGDYYIPETTNAQGFSTLGEAVTALNMYGTNSAVRFLIDGDLNENGIVVTRKDLTDTTGVTIKPAAGKTPTITITNFPTTGNAKNQGLTFQSASYMTIDGSNTDGGTTQDLTIVGDQATGAYVVSLIENADNCTIKHTNITFNNLAASGSIVGCDGYPINSVNVAPDNFLIENCNVGSATKTTANGVAIWGNYPDSPMEATIKDCNIFASRRGITTYYIKNNKYLNNNISIVNPRIDQAFYSGIYITGSPVTDTTIVANNKILKVDINRITTSIAFGIAVYGNEGVINIYNNFIALNTVNTNASPNLTFAVYGIGFNSAGWSGKANIYHNTIEIAPTLSTGRHAIIGTPTNSPAILNVYNNIFSNKHSSAVSYGIYWSNTPSTTSQLNSNYNDIYMIDQVGFVGRYTATDYQLLTNWTAATTLDSNSINKAVLFVSDNDLHVTGASNGDIDLAALPISWITTDIDGNPRLNVMVYKGADEGSISVPVELTSFAAVSTSAGVRLDWSTATETNNKGFEIQRSADNTSFEDISFVNGNGTTTEKQSYSFVDNSIANGKAYYRLKQIDYDGSYNYSNTIAVDLTLPIVFNLSQNYPNPFNPSTVINFSVPTASKVMVKIFDILGREVLTLTNQDYAAGRYNLQFNASNLASGTYIYTINANGVDGSKFQSVKKMMLIK